MQARCLNDGCSKDPWTLRKHPDERDTKLQCPQCGTTRVEITGQGTSSQPHQQGHAQPPDTVDHYDTAPPANPDQQGGGGAGLPANQQGQQDLPSRAQQGVAAADLVSALNSDDPRERADAKMETGQFAAGLVYRAFENSAQRDRERAQNIQKARQQNETVQRSQPEYCPECGAEILNPPAGQFYCPGCSTVLEGQGGQQAQGEDHDEASGRTFNGPGEV